MTISNRTRPTAPVPDQQTKELINARKTQTQQQRSESLTVTLTWHASKYKVHKLHQRYILTELYFVIAFIIFAMDLRRLLVRCLCPAVKKKKNYFLFFET